MLARCFRVGIIRGHRAGIPPLQTINHKVKMRLHKKCKIEFAASKDKSRACLMEPYLEIREGGFARIAATDGKILAVIPVECEDGETSGYVSADALKAARKGKLPEAEIHCNGALQVQGGATFPRMDSTEFSFPKIDAVTVPPNQEIHGCQRVRLVINTALLSRLAEALGSDAVVLELQAEESPPWRTPGLVVNRPIRVEPTSEGHGDHLPCAGAFGVIMPMRP